MIFKIVFRGRTYGLKNIPKHGGFLIAVNHASFLDPVFVASLPKTRIHSFARKTLFKTRLLKWYYERLHMIAVDRDGGSDLAAFKKVFKILEEGDGLVVFPEGTRTHDGELQKAKKGVGLFACKAQVAVIPARIFGSFDAWSRHQKLPKFWQPLDIVYEAPLHPKDFDPGPDAENRYEKASEVIMEAITKIQSPRNLKR